MIEKVAPPNVPTIEVTVKETKWCPQHGYPIPCNKCGLGEYERGIKEVVDWVNEFCLNNPSMSDIQGFEWQKKCREWGV
jgi:hypothetical protein